jgi:Domain of unknown function (DUF4145)
MVLDETPTPTKHFVFCTRCEKATNATEQGSVVDEGSESGAPMLVTLVSCDVCDHAMVMLQEDVGEGWDEMARVWPNPRRSLSTAVPKRLRAEHHESVKCFDAKAYTATVVMVGRTLEGVCAEHGVRERSLTLSLKRMHERNLIDERLLEWAEELRVLRNDGAHYTGSQVGREDASDALALCEALLDYMYVLTAKFNEFRDRRAARKNVPADSPPDGVTAGPVP